MEEDRNVKALAYTLRTLRERTQASVDRLNNRVHLLLELVERDSPAYNLLQEVEKELEVLRAEVG